MSGGQQDRGRGKVGRVEDGGKTRDERREEDKMQAWIREQTIPSLDKQGLCLCEPLSPRANPMVEFGLGEGNEFRSVCSPPTQILFGPQLSVSLPPFFCVLLWQTLWKTIYERMSSCAKERHHPYLMGCQVQAWSLYKNQYCKCRHRQVHKGSPTNKINGGIVTY